MSKTIWIINQVASTPETGMGGRHYHLARGLEAAGYRVYVVVASYMHLLREPPEVAQRYKLERREGVNMVWVKVPRYAQAHSKKRILNWFIFSHRIKHLDRVIPDRPDVIVYSSPSLVGYLGAEKLARRLGAKLAFEVRDIWPLTLCEVGGYSPSHPFIRFLQWVENRAYRNADVVLSNLKNAHVHMIRHGLERKKFHWVPNGVWLNEVAKPDALPVNVAEQLPADKFLVGYAGTLGLANCLGTLLETAVRLKDEAGIHFVLVGSGREKAALQQRARELRLANVTFVDAIPKAQVQSLLARFDTLYLGAKKSPLYRFGVAMNKLYDYLYADTPILYAIDSGDYHPVTDAGAGFELPPEDPQALADAVLKLYRMPAAERVSLGQHGRDAVLAQYEYGVLARQLAAVLFPDKQ